MRTYNEHLRAAIAWILSGSAAGGMAESQAKLENKLEASDQNPAYSRRLTPEGGFQRLDHYVLQSFCELEKFLAQDGGGIAIHENKLNGDMELHDSR